MHSLRFQSDWSLFDYALLHYALRQLYNYATVAWVGGVFCYLGREVQDAEKGTAADGFDYSGLGAPIVAAFNLLWNSVCCCESVSDRDTEFIHKNRNVTELE